MTVPPEQKQSSRASPYQWTTDCALIKTSDRNVAYRRAEKLHEFFSENYMQAKQRNYEQACEAAGSCLDGEFGVSGSKIRHYSAFTLEPYNLAYYEKPAFHEQRRRLLSDSGDVGKEAFLLRKRLVGVDTFNLIAAQVPVNKEAMDYFKDKDRAIVITKRDTKLVKDKPYFLHYSKESVAPGPYVILPLEFRANRSGWTTNAADERIRFQSMSAMHEIAGVAPMKEMLQSSGEENLAHPCIAYNGPDGKSARYYPGDCGKWNCPICFSLMKFEQPMKYAKFFGA